MTDMTTANSSVGHFRQKSVGIVAITLLGLSVIPTTSGAHLSANPKQVMESNDSTSTVSIDSLLLKSVENKDVELQEITVTASKPLVQSDGATLTYNVDEDPDSKSSSLMEMLRKVPKVTVDAEENVKVNGQSGFIIYINGKEDPMLKGDLKTILKSIPASTVRKIEVISEPGAKYSAEGVGGILNIVTDKKMTLEGYLANISAWGNNYSVGGSVYARTKYNKVTASANVSYWNSAPGKSRQISESVTEIEDATVNHYQYRTSRSRNVNGGGLNANLNFSWEPDTLNLFTLSGYFGDYSQKSRMDQAIRTETEDHLPTGSLENYGLYKNSGDWGGATASYQHTFGREGHNIVGSYQVNFGANKSDGEQHTFNVFQMWSPAPWRTTGSNSHYVTHTVQVDYTNVFNTMHTLEAGFKGKWDPDNSDSKSGYGEFQDAIIIDPAERVKVHQFSDIMAAYLSYSLNWKKFSGKAGLRFEHTHTGLRYHIGDYDNFTSNYSDWVPNAALSYRFTDTRSLRLAYQMRIRRPGIYQMNPYVNDMTVNSMSYGNPDLKSSRFHNVNLTFSDYGTKLGGSFSLGYSQNNNQVVNYIFTEDNILKSTYANIGRYRNMSATGDLQWTIIPTLQFSVYLWGNYSSYKATSPNLTQKNDGFSGGYNANLNYTFPFKLRLSGYAGGGTPDIDLQGKGVSWYYYGLSLSRSFLKEDRLSVNLGVQNIIPTHRTYDYSYSNNGVIMNTKSRSAAWSVSASVSIRLGSLRSDVKRTSSRLDSDDNKGGNSGGNSGGGR